MQSMREGFLQGCVCPVEPRKDSKITETVSQGSGCIPATVSRKRQNSADIQNPSLVNGLENLRR